MTREKKLQEEYVAKTKECVAIRKELEAIRMSKHIPKLKAKYEGKYFKYQNSMGSDEKWWVYSHCKEIVDINYAEFNSFETRTDKSCFEVRLESGYFLCEKQITKEEYQAELKKFKQNVNKL